MSDEAANLADLTPDQRLEASAPQFDFFQAVRILERAALNAGAATDGPSPSSVPIGQDGPPDREPVRFRGLPSLGFPAAPIVSVTRPAKRVDTGESPGGGAVPADMLVTFMALAGPGGVLPDHYTSQLIERVRYKDYGLRDFLDLFNHRLISLFYRAWEKYRFEAAYERRGKQPKPDQREKIKPSLPWDDTDDFTSVLLSLVGLGTGALQHRTSIEDETLIFYAGHFSHQSRCAASLELLLNDYFGLPVEVHQFQGQWMPLAREDQSQLGREFCRLGGDLVLGERVWDVQGKFRVRVGPLRLQQYIELLPTGVGLRKMFDLVRLYVGVEFDFDVQPLLLASEIPKFRLGPDAKNPNWVAGRLGRNVWLVSRPASKEFDGALFASAMA